jgi:hypothetical protein
LIRGADGNMHAVDPRLQPPGKADAVPALSTLIDRGHADEALLARVAAGSTTLQRALEQALLHTP